MANKFVWSGATGLDDGTSWANAYLSMVRDWGVEPSFDPAVDYVYVRSVHAETPAGIADIVGSSTPESPARIVSVLGAATGTAPGALTKGAKVTTASDLIRNNGHLYVYGIEFNSGNGNTVGNSGDMLALFESCDFVNTSNDNVTLGNSANNVKHESVFLNCGFDLSNVTKGISFSGKSVRLVGCVWKQNTNDIIVALPSRGGLFEILNCDLSLFTGGVVDGVRNTGGFSLNISRCSMGAGSVIVNGTVTNAGFTVTSSHNQIGTDADPSFQKSEHRAAGKIETDANVYRVGGASDGVRATPISWKATPDKARFPAPALALIRPIVAFAPTGLKTYRLYIASNAQQTNRDVWAEFTLVSDVDTSSLAVMKSTRMVPLGTPVAYPLDGVSSWVGSDTSVIQVIEVTHTAMKAGAVSARILMASDAGVDGFIHVDGVLEIV